MRLQDIVIGLSAIAVVFGASCATSTDGNTGGAGPGGAAGGTADDDGSGGAGNDNTVGPGGLGGGGMLTDCGDGVIEPPETCDGDDFGGKTCETFGLTTGALQCNPSCQIVVSACGFPENCDNGVDDDGDGAIDCVDTECTDVPGCMDSCAAPQAVALPTFDLSTTIGRPDTYAPSCAAATGSERIYEVTPTLSGLLGISVNQSAGDFTVAVMTTCGDMGSEIACSANVSNQDFPENLQIDVTAGNTYWVVVDAATPTDSEDFDVQMVILSGGESACFDLSDGDADGLIDCNDPDCQTNATCTDGTAAVGTACMHTGQCASVQDDPICLPSVYGFDGGYCSEFCNLSANDCPGDGQCYDYGIGPDGVCLDGCVNSSECRTGYACLDLGLATRVCYIAPESDCDNFEDDDFDGLTDCDDPNCQATPGCMPGSNDYGEGCDQNDECASNTGDDPLCLRNPPFFFPDGYCSEFCNVAASDCGPGAVCSDYFFLDGTTGQCFKRCLTGSDCGSGLSCVDYGFGKHCNL